MYWTGQDWILNLDIYSVTRTVQVGLTLTAYGFIIFTWNWKRTHNGALKGLLVSSYVYFSLKDWSWELLVSLGHACVCVRCAVWVNISLQVDWPGTGVRASLKGRHEADDGLIAWHRDSRWQWNDPCVTDFSGSVAAQRLPGPQDCCISLLPLLSNLLLWGIYAWVNLCECVIISRWSGHLCCFLVLLTPSWHGSSRGEPLQRRQDWTSWPAPWSLVSTASHLPECFTVHACTTFAPLCFTSGLATPAGEIITPIVFFGCILLLLLVVSTLLKGNFYAWVGC